MTNNSMTNHTLPVIAIMIGVICIVLTLVAFASVFPPPTVRPTQTVIQPTSSPSSPYQPEIIPIPTETPDLTPTATIEPTDTPWPAFTPTVTPTSMLINGPLPDLTVTGLNDPICVPDHIGTIFGFTVYVHNIGRVPTRSFGPFDVGVYIILGQHRYGLDEWRTKFNGVVGTSNLKISNLDPKGDTKLILVIDLLGNKNFGIEVIANSGEYPIPEVDTTNNTLIKYYSVYCY
jgi:hypothetical protein